MQLSRKAFVGAVVVALGIGAALGAFTTSRAAISERVPLLLAQAPPAVQAPILPVQMPLTTGTFAKVAETIKPAVININTTVSRGRRARRPDAVRGVLRGRLLPSLLR